MSDDRVYPQDDTADLFMARVVRIGGGEGENDGDLQMHIGATG